MTLWNDESGRGREDRGPKTVTGKPQEGVALGVRHSTEGRPQGTEEETGSNEAINGCKLLY